MIRKPEWKNKDDDMPKGMCTDENSACFGREIRLSEKAEVDFGKGVEITTAEGFEDECYMRTSCFNCGKYIVKRKNFKTDRI